MKPDIIGRLPARTIYMRKPLPGWLGLFFDRVVWGAPFSVVADAGRCCGRSGYTD
jgi:hypothetical protein